MLDKQLLRAKLNLAAQALLHLGGADYEGDKSRENGLCQKGLVARDFGIQEWDWPQGVGLHELNQFGKIEGKQPYDSFFDTWYAGHFAAGLPSRNVNTTMPFLTLLDYVQRHPCKEYEDACYERAQWLMQELPRTVEGGFQHVTSAIGDRNGIVLNEDQLWVDTLFMSVLFLNRAGFVFERNDFIDESVRQVLVHLKYLYDKKSKLFYHGWSFARNDNFGGIFWGRGNSWFTLGIMEFIAQNAATLDKGVLAFLKDTYKAQAKALRALQAPSGLWHTVLDDASSYEEVSGTAGIAAGILKGISMGVLDASYVEMAEKAVEAICANITQEGVVQQVSAGTALGMNAQFYKEILTRPMAYGQALTVAALCEALAFAP